MSHDEKACVNCGEDRSGDDPKRCPRCGASDSMVGDWCSACGRERRVDPEASPRAQNALPGVDREENPGEFAGVTASATSQADLWRKFQGACWDCGSTAHLEAPRTSDDPPVVTINMQTPKPKLLGGHVHGCPECFEKVPCDEVCDLELDLFKDGETPCGSYATCDACEAKRVSETATPHHRAIGGKPTSCASADEQITVLGREVERLTEALRGIASVARAHDDHGIEHVVNEALAGGPRRPTATLTEDERAELKRLRRSTLADLPRLFDEIGDAMASFEASSTSEDERAGARGCLRLVAKIRDRWLGGQSRESPITTADDAWETRNDGQRVRKDRWETGIRRIVGILYGNRTEFEVDEVVEYVRVLWRAAKVAADIHALRKVSGAVVIKGDDAFSTFAELGRAMSALRSSRNGDEGSKSQ
jgi:hypothetical protein